MTTRLICLCWCVLSLLPAYAQYQTYGDASAVNLPGVPASCFTLTPAQANQLGAVYHLTPINLMQPQDIQVSFYLGNNDAGADGMAFVMRDTSEAPLGNPGGAFGYGGLNPSLGVEFDTYANVATNDPTFDHMSLSSNGIVDHNAGFMLTPAVQILPGINDLEDNAFHSLRITWDPGIDSFQVYVDCIQRIAYQGDLLNLVFDGDSIVYWGFAAGTGGAFNLHQVCIDTVVNTLPAVSNTICAGDTLNLTAGGGDEYLWQPSTGLSDSTVADPDIFPSDTTTYTVTYKDPCGVRTVETFQVNVVPAPTLPLAFADTLRFCAGEDSLLDLPFANTTFQWQDGSSDSTYLIDGPGLVWVQASSGCTVVRDSLFAAYDTLPQVALGPDLELCEGDTVNLDATDPRATGYFWQDGTIGPLYDITQPGNYWVTLINRCGEVSDTVRAVYDSLPRFDLGPDTTLCDQNSYLLDAFYRGATYLWNDGSTDTTLRVTQPGLYWAQTDNRCGTWRDSIVIAYDSLPQVELGDPQERCEGDSITLDAAWPGATYAWSTGDTTPNIQVDSSAVYSVAVSNGCGTATDEVAITFLPQPEADLGPDTTLCDSESLLLDATQPDATYLWGDGSSGATFPVNQAGTYWVEVSRATCNDRDTIVVSTARTPSVSLGEDRLLCDGETATLDASFPDPSVTYQWNDGSAEPRRQIDQPGVYRVTLRNACGQVDDQVEIQTSEVPQVDLGGNQTICEDDSLLLDASFPNATYRWQDGSRQATFLASRSGVFTVTVQTDCGEASDQVEIRQVAPPQVNLGPDTLACEGQVLRLQVSPGQGDILWQDGSTEPVLEVTRTGIYGVAIENVCGTEGDEVAIEFLDCDCRFYVPNAFTPNEDEFNDDFRPITSCQVEGYQFRIFDRWGRSVFQTDQVDESWDGRINGGRPAPTGTYVWTVTYQIPTSQGLREAQQSGSLTLVR